MGCARSPSWYQQEATDSHLGALHGMGAPFLHLGWSQQGVIQASWGESGDWFRAFRSGSSAGTLWIVVPLLCIRLKETQNKSSGDNNCSYMYCHDQAHTFAALAYWSTSSPGLFESLHCSQSGASLGGSLFHHLFLSLVLSCLLPTS